MGHIQRHHISEALVVVARSGILEQANEVMKPLWDRSVANSLESRTLAAIRDALLPKLMSGEIRVTAAEEFVAREA